MPLNLFPIPESGIWNLKDQLTRIPLNLRYYFLRKSLRRHLTYRLDFNNCGDNKIDILFTL